MWLYLLTALAVSVAINVAMFLIAYRRGTDKLTDASYAITFIVLAAYGFLQSPFSLYRLALFAMVTLWAVRLGGFLLFRIWKTGKDSRFDAMRGSFWKFGKFWLSQGLAVWIILVPSLLALRSAHTPATTTLMLVAGLAIVIWLKGVVVEGLADLQKYRFTSQPANKGKWITSGLWSWSRHPNYFGEILVWVGVYVYALTTFTATEAVIGLVSPLFITILLLFVSGIPILEKSADDRWGKDPAYRMYKRRTSLLIPRPPRQKT